MVLAVEVTTADDDTIFEDVDIPVMDVDIWAYRNELYLFNNNCYNH